MDSDDRASAHSAVNSPEDQGGLVGALAKALASRRPAVNMGESRTPAIPLTARMNILLGCITLYIFLLSHFFSLNIFIILSYQVYSLQFSFYRYILIP